MSYILEALKKAAEQRDAHVPAMRRLFSPAPEVADSPRWRLAAVAGGAAVVGAIVAVWVLWPTAPGVATKDMSSPVVAARTEPPTPAVAARADATPAVAARAESAATPAVPAQTPASPPVRTAPKPMATVKPSAEKPAAPLLAPSGSSRQAPVESVAPRPQPTESVAPRPQPTESVAPRPQPEAVAPPSKAVAPPANAAVRPAPGPAVAPVPATASRDAGGPLRVEVIVYSDERERRLAFINGRKYVEGDVLQDGTRIQEIQPNAVVIIDDGRRVVLRP